jgi:hypothetical protein
MKAANTRVLFMVYLKVVKQFAGKYQPDSRLTQQNKSIPLSHKLYGSIADKG